MNTELCRSISFGGGTRRWQPFCALVLSCFRLCLTLCNPVDWGPAGSSVHGILQARILEWVATPSSRGSSQPKDQTQVSYISCIGRRVLYHSCLLGAILVLLKICTLQRWVYLRTVLQSFIQSHKKKQAQLLFESSALGPQVRSLLLSPEMPGGSRQHSALSLLKAWTFDSDLSSNSRSAASCLWSLVCAVLLTLCYPVNCSPPGFSVHGILQGRILEWVAILFRGYFQPRDQPDLLPWRQIIYHLSH